MAVVSFWLAASLLAPAQPGVSNSVRVGVVSIPMVSEQYLRTADLETHFENERRKFNEGRDALTSKMDRMARSLQEELKPGTDEFRERTKQLALLDAELKWFTESEGRKIERGLATSFRTIFADIQAAVREIARERGIDLVLAADSVSNEVPDSPLRARQEILLQKVLYFNPRIDLTNDVIAHLNAKHKARGSSGPVGSALPAEPAGSATPGQEPSRPEAATQGPGGALASRSHSAFVARGPAVTIDNVKLVTDNAPVGRFENRE